MSATQDLISGFDPTSIPAIAGSDLLNMINGATPFTDTGFVVTTSDVAGNPTVPNASVTTKWQTYLWRRLGASAVTMYAWNPNAATDATYLKWQSITVSSIPANTITNAMLQTGSVTDDKIANVSWGKIIGVPAGFNPIGAAGGDLTGTYPNPTIGPNTVTSSKLESDAAVDANRAVGTNHLQNGCVTAAKLDPSLTALVAPGMVAMFATSAAPTGWLLCDGSEVSIATYTALSAAIYIGDGNNANAAYAYGYKTDGATHRTTAGDHIKLPDCRGYFPRGLDNGAGVDVGRNPNSTQAGQVLNHNHFIANADAPANPTGALTLTNANQLAGGPVGGSARSDDYVLKGTATAATIGLTSNPVANGGTENRPINIVFNFYIKT